MTPHIESKLEDVASLVLMPGDPLRAQYIANNFLIDVKEINGLRNMLAFTGTYQGKRITVFSSGMGIPSMGIYAYELYHFYHVEKIIRIGTAGTSCPETKVNDIIVATGAHSLSNFAYAFNGEQRHYYPCSFGLTNKIISVACDQNINIKSGPLLTSEIFDLYTQNKDITKFVNDKIKPIACEMEAFALFCIASNLKKEAATLVTVTDSPFEENMLSTKEREQGLNKMIKLALDSIIK